MPAHRWDPTCRPPRDLVRPVAVDPHGIDGPTRHEVREHGWRRTTQGFYVPAGTPTDVPEQRILEQSLRLPRGGVVTGWAALRLHGARFFDGFGPDGRTEHPVPLAVGPGGRIRGSSRVTVSWERLTTDECLVRQGIPVATVERALFDAMRTAGDARGAVIAMDMTAAAGLVSIRRMRAYVEEHRTWRRAADLPAALLLASEHSRSPREVELRLVWRIDAGLPPVLVNCPVHDRDGRLLGIADLLDVEAGLAVEFDGAEHRTASRHTRDVAKDEAFRSRRLEVTRVTGQDLRDRDLVVRRLHAARSRARFEPEAQRLWVPRPPRDDLHDRLVEREERIRVHEQLERDASAPE